MKRLSETAPMRVILLTIVACLLAYSASFSAAENDITATVTTSPESLFIGDEISLVLQLSHSDSIDVTVTGITAALDSFELIRRDSVVTTEAGGRIVHEVKMSLTTFETGELTPGPFTVTYTENGRPDTLELNGSLVRVKSLLEEKPSDIRDIKGIVPVQGVRWPWIGGGILVLACFTWYLIWRHRRTRTAGSPDVEDVTLPPADVWALERLDRIDRMELLTRGRVKEHYIRVTEVLRKFLGMYYGVETLERTTGEILIDLEKAGVPADRKTLLRELLIEADLVKFARFIPDESEAASFIPRVRNAVESIGSEVRQEVVGDAVR